MTAAGTDTIVAAATARGPGMRGVVRLSGPRTSAILAGRCGGLPEARAAAVRFSLRDPDDASGAFADADVDVCLWRFPGPRSFTGEDAAELHLPGAPQLMDLVLRLLVRDGARVAEPGEFTRRAAESGRIDLTRAEAVLATIRARDEAEHRRARGLLDGGLAKEAAALIDRLIGLSAPLELALDFSDQDVEIVAPLDHASRIAELAEEVARLALPERGSARRGLYRAVLRGPANAGKSSLFNRLLRREAALATPVRGTTRDVVTGLWESGGVRAVLVDTAGDDVFGGALDDAAHAVRARALLEADLILEVRDVRRLAGVGADAAPAQDPGPTPRLNVATFADLAPPPARGVAAAPILVSNTTGAGLAALEAAMVAALTGPSSGAGAEPFAVSARASAAFAASAAALRTAAEALPELPPEFAAADLAAALRALRAVTFAEPGDPVLDRIFRDFCIGK